MVKLHIKYSCSLCLFPSAHTHTHTHRCVRTCICTQHTHTCTHTHTHTHTHACPPKSSYVYICANLFLFHLGMFITNWILLWASPFQLSKVCYTWNCLILPACSLTTGWNLSGKKQGHWPHTTCCRRPHLTRCPSHTRWAWWEGSPPFSGEGWSAFCAPCCLHSCSMGQFFQIVSHIWTCELVHSL